METRKLGALKYRSLIGCMNLATNYGPAAPIDDAIKVIREAHRNGVTFFTTASCRTLYERVFSLLAARLNCSATK